MAKYESDSQKWQQRYSLAVKNQDKMFRRFAGWYDLLYAAINTRNYAPWRSKVFIPVVASKAWNMIAKLQALKPGFNVGLYNDYLNDPDASSKADKAQWKLEHDWNNPLFDEPMTSKLFSSLVDALVCGTGLAKVPWVTKDRSVYSRTVKDTTTGTTDYSKEKVTTKKVGYNDLIPVNIFNVFVAPGAVNLYTAPWLMIKDYKTVAELEAINNANKTPIYDLSKVKEMRADSDKFAEQKKARNRLTQEQDPIAIDYTLDQVEIYECYERDSNYICTYAVGKGSTTKDQWVEIRKQKNPYWHGKYPLVAFYVRERPFDFWGQGLFEDTERMQAATNDLFNHVMDSTQLSLDGMVVRQENERFRYIVQPGGELIYRNNKPEFAKFPEPNPGIFQTLGTMMMSAIEDATLSQYAAGTPNSATDKTSGTASGIHALQEAAGDKIGWMKSNFSNSLRWIGTMWLSNNQQFMTQPVTVQGQEGGRPAPVTITPDDLQFEAILRIDDASMEPQSKEQKMQAFLAYMQQLNQLQQESIAQAQMTKWVTKPIYYDYGVLMQDLSELMGQANYDKLLIPNDEVEQAMQNSRSPFITPHERLNINMADLMPSEVGQVLDRNGIQADPARMQGVLPPQEQEMTAPKNPTADAQLMQDAQGLVAGGHVHPAVVDHLSGLPSQQPAPTMPTSPPIMPGHKP